jgi:hypothetical protein
LLGSHIGPNLVALKAANPDIADMGIMVLHTGFAKIDQQFGDRVSGNPGHSGGGADTIPLNQGRYNPYAFFVCQRVHIDHYA